MAENVTLSTVGDLTQTTTAANTINSNFAVIETAFSDVLSRSGVPSNQMSANLDMNSNRILNLLAPSSADEPVRLTDLATYATGGTVTFNAVPVGGTTGQALVKNSNSNYDTIWGSVPINPIWNTLQTFAANIHVGNGSFSTDDSAILVSRNLSYPNGLIVSHAFRDETVSHENVTANQFSGYCSFDSFSQMLGTAVTPQNHYRCFQARPYLNITGQCNAVEPFWSGPIVDGASTVVPDLLHFHATQPQILNGATVTVQAAFYSDPLSGAATNYFLFGNGSNNPSVLNGNLYIGGSLNPLVSEITNIRYNGSTNFGLLFQDTYASAAALTAVSFYRNNVNVGAITETLTGTNYGITSDERLKNFIGNYDPKEAIRIIKADPVRDFNWKVNDSYDIGWGAQTSYSISPTLAIHTENDNWTIDKGARTPYLWAAMSDVLDRLEAIEKKLND